MRVFGLSASLTKILSAVALVLLLVVTLLIMGYCSQREKAQQARDAQTQAEGRTVSATEAIKEIGSLNERGQATDIQVENAQNAIRQADPADRDRIARYHLCVLQQQPDCKRL